MPRTGRDAPPRRRRALAWLGAIAATLLLAELSVAVLVHAGVLETPKPTRGGGGFWQGRHPTFGVWHEPDAETVHERDCFRVTYATNSVGARDVERSPASSAPRVVVLGDSFFEGWGVRREERLSDRLEAETGFEHLNFAMSHFGPYQQLLVYRELASRFEHDAVIASVVPENDFLDLDRERADAMPNYDYRYRPYLVAGDAGFEHLDHGEPALRRTLRQHSYAFNAALVARRTFDGPSSSEKLEPGVPRSPIRSEFYDFTPRDLRRLAEILRRLVDAAGERPVAVVLVPVERDLERYRISGPAPLSHALKQLGAREGFAVVDLLPRLAAQRMGWRYSFHACDYHWSAEGNALATRSVLERLDAGFYRTLRERR